MTKQRVFVISDIHIDYKENRDALLALSNDALQHDTLIIAGDATDDLTLLESFLSQIAAKFHAVLFVPGNHELWVKRSERIDSVSKFNDVIAVCERVGVSTQSFSVKGIKTVHIVPLFSWYHTNDHPDFTLYLEKKGVEDKTYDMWSDFFVTQWPEPMNADICRYFLDMNEPVINQQFSEPVISVSHFLPRTELMLSTEEERRHSDLKFKDLHPEFNFSHVAGSKGIDRQIRKLGSQLHVYGHQHRNRIRRIDGVTYLSHCMGYPKERMRGVVAEHCVQPMEIWNDHEGFIV